LRRFLLIFGEIKRKIKVEPLVGWNLPVIFGVFCKILVANVLQWFQVLWLCRDTLSSDLSRFTFLM
jgi:hypothetical protein